MAGEKVATPSDPMAGLAGLAQLLGGTQQTVSAGDTSGLQFALAGLQGASGNYEALLRSIFQQASGQIPGLQAGLSNALGARTGKNSPVAAALQQLLAQTAVGAQKQISDQQLQNFQTQVQAGQGIAQATRGTTQQSGTNLGGAAKNLAILSALKKLGLGDLIAGDKTAQAVQATPASQTPAFAVPGSDYFVGPLATQAPQADLFSSNPDFAGFNAADFTFPEFSPSINTDFNLPDYAVFDSPETSAQLDLFNSDLPSFADGGIVRAAGSRRGANPQVEQAAPVGTGVQTAMQGKLAPEIAQTLQALIQQAPDAQGSASLNSGFASGPANPNAGAMLGKAAALSGLSGLTGGPSLPGLGMVSSLAQAKSPEQALGVMGMQAANIAAPGLGNAIAVGMNPSLANLANFATSFNPATAAINLGLSLVDTDLGTIGTNIADQLNPNQMMNPAQQQIASEFAAQLAAQTEGGNGSFGGYGDRGPGGSSGDVGASEGGAGPGGPGGYKHGGPVDGKGTGTSDSINAWLSDGEYVMSADTVKALGEEFFDHLQAAFHKPVGRM